jgi:hypothetical protein
VQPAEKSALRAEPSAPEADTSADGAEADKETAPIENDSEASVVSVEAEDTSLPGEAEQGAQPKLWLPPGWDKLRAWAADAPHLPAWWEDGMRPEEDPDELLFRADVNFFFATSLEGTSSEERELKKELLFNAEKNFFFAKGLADKEPPSPPPEKEPAYTINPQSHDTDSSAAQMSKEEELSPEDSKANKDEPTVSAAREKIRKMAESALSYEEQQWNRPQRQPRAKPPKRELSIANGEGAQRAWWEKSASTAPRQKCIKYPPDLGNLNI